MIHTVFGQADTRCIKTDILYKFNEAHSIYKVRNLNFTEQTYDSLMGLEKQPSNKKIVLRRRPCLIGFHYIGKRGVYSKPL